METFKALAREVAQRDREMELSPPKSIEEMILVLGQLVLDEYAKAYPAENPEKIPEALSFEVAPAALCEAYESHHSTCEVCRTPEQRRSCGAYRPPAFLRAFAQAERLVSDGDRATLALNLQRAAVGEINPSAEFLRVCARAITGPTKRELDLDAILHSAEMGHVLNAAHARARTYHGKDLIDAVAWIRKERG